MDGIGPISLCLFLPNSMSRVAWRSLAQRSNFDFMHTASGRLHADQLMQRSTVGWAVCGRADFVKASCRR